MDREPGDAVLLLADAGTSGQGGEKGREIMIRAATPAAAALYRYAPGELDGLPLAVLAPPGATPATHGTVAQRRKDGSFFVATLEAEAIPGGQRVDVREASAERSLFDGLPVAALVFDAEVREIIAANPLAHRLYGYPPGELVGHRVDDIVDAAAGSSSVLHRRRDGSFFHASVVASVTTFHGRPARMAVIQDVTERERLIRTLRESEERYRLLFDVGPLARWLYDVESLRIVAVNDVAVRQSGFSRDELLAMRISELRLPDDVAASTPPVGGGPAVHRLRKKDGLTVEVELSSHALTLDGRTVMLVSAQDIGERRRLVEQLLHAQKMEAIGRLAGGVAHDFNNLLAVILVVSEWVERQLGEGHRLYLEIEEIRTAALRAASLTRQLLAFSRQQTSSPRVFGLHVAVADLEKMLRRLIGEDVELEVALPGDGPTIRADLGQIEQVIMNLAVNARDAMPHGGRLRITTGAVELDAGAAAAHDVEPGRFAVLAVSDTGVGIDAKVRGRIFEPFFTTKESGKGTGLGLSTVANIVRQLGGAIDVVSTLGDGTTFRVFLPGAEPIAELPRDRPGRRLDGGSRATILLVEDHEQIRSAIRRILTANGYLVVEAPSGEAAEIAGLELCDKEEPVHVLVTDVVMPGVGGRATATRLRELFPRLRVIYMSAYAEHATLDDDLRTEAGASFLAKPFSVDQLAAAVRSALDV